jgi:transcriptional regulator with XRE-family HTH domain
MKAQDIGTVKLAEASGVNKETISLWRKGRQQRYTVATVAQVATQLGTTAEELLELPLLPSEERSRSEAEAAEAPKGELIRRIAALAPVIDQLSELEELVAEAKKLSEE